MNGCDEPVLPARKTSAQDLVGSTTNSPDADEVVSVAGEEGSTVSGPSKGDALNGSGLGVLAFLLGLLFLGVGELRFQVGDASLGFEVPDHDRGGGGSTEPVPDGREHKSVDNVTGFEGRQVAAFVEVPQVCSAVFATGSAQRTIRGDGYGVDVASVAKKVGAELAVVEVPDLDNAVPAGRNDQRNLKVRAEADTGNPFFVAIFLDGVFALSKSVPQVDGTVTGAGHNLTVVRRECNGENVLGVANEAAGGGAGVEVPQTESAIARARQSKLTIGRDGDVLDGVGVAGETFLGNTSALFVADEVPHDKGFITRSRKHHVRGFQSGGNGGNPAAVAFQFTAKYERLVAHCFLIVWGSASSIK
mmetsp:Transcript_11114/g.15943  ORF Transcript_11114/g.15943 Transcript_11114/m.15943 type:complete len:361 (+) Transcript_11114:135-1217(+)